LDRLVAYGRGTGVDDRGGTGMATVVGEWRAPRSLAQLVAFGLAVLVAAAFVAGGRGVVVATLSMGAGTAAAIARARRSVAARSKEVARLSELVDRRAEQVAALSHELRTPLTMIKGSADLLLEGTPGPLTSAQERFLTVIDQQCAHVIALCESLLI